MTTISLKSYNILPDTGEDLTEEITRAMSDAASKGLTLVFPSGTYVISEDIQITNNLHIQSEELGGAVFKGPSNSDPVTIKNAGWDEPAVDNASIKGFTFDNVNLKFSGHATNIEISENLFLNGEGHQDQVAIANGSFEIHDNVFLGTLIPNDTSDQLRAIATYSTKDTTIANNSIGSVDPENMTDEQYSSSVLELFRVAEGYDEGIDLSEAGYYKTGAGGSRDTNLTIKGNTISGDESRSINEENDFYRDHAIYFHHFDGLEIHDNTFSGWPPDASGGVKIRNGSDLNFEHNTLDNISLLTYSYTSSQTDLTNTTIAHNNISSEITGISYWEDGTGTGVHDLFIHDNTITNTSGGHEIGFLPVLTNESSEDQASNIHIFNNTLPDGSAADVAARSNATYGSEAPHQIRIYSAENLLNPKDPNTVPGEDGNGLSDLKPGETLTWIGQGESITVDVLDDTNDRFEEDASNQTLMKPITFNGTSYEGGQVVTPSYTMTFAGSDGNIYKMSSFNFSQDEMQSDTDGFFWVGSKPPAGTTLTLTKESDASAANALSYTSAIMCFQLDTFIKTPSGDKKIQDLAIGDLVLNEAGQEKPIRWIGNRVIDADELALSPKLLPIRISKGTLGHGLPSRDLLVSQQHRIMIRSPVASRMFGSRDVLVSARNLLKIDGIYIDESVAPVHYFHILLDQHDVILAENTAAETLFTGKSALAGLSHQSLDEIFTIFPTLRARHSEQETIFLAPPGKLQRKLVWRHSVNRKPLVSVEVVDEHA